jgi:hypothetical protein
MPINIALKVVKIDHFGFVGREHHPTQDMVGHIAHVLTIANLDEECSDPNDILNVVGLDPKKHLQAFDCVLDDGRLVTLMDYEVEPWYLSEKHPLPLGPLARAMAVAWFEGRWSRRPMSAGW